MASVSRGHDSDSDEASVALFKVETQKSWTERVFYKRECCRFVPSLKDKGRCGCGRVRIKHLYLHEHEASINTASLDKWSPLTDSEASATDAYGTVEFQGGPHPTKAQYVRISYDTRPELLLQLLTKQWKLELPKLLISIHGGIANFELQPKLKRVFKKGLLKAAKTTGAWIVTGGINTGVMKHVGDALGDTLLQSRNNIVTIGIAPWGVVQSRNELIGREIVTPYHSVSNPKSHNVVLNSNHSYFMLVDNGTIGKYGAEILLRKKLEKYISQQKITTRSGTKNYHTPVVSLIMEGGTNTIRTVLECITDTPPVPVVVCDGSGRAADLIAFTHKYAQDDGTMTESLRDQLILTIEKTFQYTREQAEKLFIELMLCVKKKELITVFRMGEGSQDIDLAILTALLKAQNSSAPDQLSLALTWNRVDIARSYIFVYGQEWPDGALDQAMMDALVNDRVEFVRLLLENGVSMPKWLTIHRLEELYNIKQDSYLRYLVKELKKHLPAGYRYTLYDIGLVIEKLMGGAYRATFCRKKFRHMYNAVMKKYSCFAGSPYNNQGHNISNILVEIPLPVDPTPFKEVFRYPYHELMIWAVLMRRHAMAKFMWQHGEEALAKSLVACRLYKSMAYEAAQDDLEQDISEELKGCAKEFTACALELLEQCYKTDDDRTQQLLTYELSVFSDQTCLSLAVAAIHRDFIAHTCCQLLLTEMWMGGLRMRKYTTLKVLLGIVFFPSILFLDFRSKEELQLMPQTEEEHFQEMEDSDSDTSCAGDDHDNDSVDNEVRTTPSHPDEVSLRYDEKTSQPNGSIVTNQGPGDSLIRKSSPLRLGKKIYEFYTAPIYKFWSHSLMYIAFLMVFTYVVLVKTPPIPSWQEWFVIAYMFTFAIEKVREIVVSEPKKMSQKIYVHYSEVWNITDAIAILLFCVAVVLRLIPGINRGHGRVCYVVDIIFWYIRILDIFSVSKYLGPYVMMIGKMVRDMIQFIVILLVVLMAFGVVRQSITYQNEDPHWGLARDIFLKPYFMIYGEVYAPEIDPPCSDDEDSEYKCYPGRWVTPAVMSIYLFVANILLINLLIAVFNNTFYKVNAISLQVWKFQRYNLVIEYEMKPVLPPPLIIICHVYLLIKFIARKCRGKREYFDTGLKLFLSGDDVEGLHDFEEECMEDLNRTKETQATMSQNERVRVTTERVENMNLRMDDIIMKENSMRLSLQTVDYRLAKLEEIALKTAESLQVIHNFITESQRPSPMEEAIPVDEEGVRVVYTSRPRLTQKSMERLRPFTSRGNKRARFARAMTVGSSVTLSREDNRLRKLGTGDQNHSVDETSSRPTENTDQNDSPIVVIGGSELYKRRRTNALSKMRTQSLAHCSPVDERPELTENKTRVSFSDEPVSVAPSSAAAKISRLKKKRLNLSKSKTLTINPSTGTQYTPPASGQYTVACHGASADMTYSTAPASVPQTAPATSSNGFNFAPYPISPPAQSSTIQPPKHLHNLSHPSSMPITPIITPSRSEYTSITDDIDTTVARYGSPCGSPVTPHRPFSGFEVDVDLYTSYRRGSKKQKTPPITGLERLKDAEESEHAQMELLIKKRIRQISLTENDSISNIAKHVAQDMEDSTDSEDDLAKSGYHSDTEDGMTSSRGKRFTGMKHVASEPCLKFDGVTDTHGSLHFKSKSASPPGFFTGDPKKFVWRGPKTSTPVAGHEAPC